MKYRREIDGLRAVSVLGVIFFHAGVEVVSGGFVGVDIFFVISGYLITSILLSEMESNTFTLVKFYERRARRILPALFVVLFACMPFAWLWLVPADMKSFSASVMAVTGFVSNIYFYGSTGYFDTAAEWKPLLHTWSLAVEEQYYLFFPLLLMMTRGLGKIWIVLLLVILAVVSLAVAQWGSANNAAAAFYLLPARGWELLIGAFVAFYVSRYDGQGFDIRLSQLGSALGALLIFYALFAFNKLTPFPSLYTLVPTVGAALIILFATSNTIVGRLLGNPLLVGVGLISYSAYLWHWPLFVFARHKSIPSVPSQLLLIGLSFGALVLGYISWKYIETPFRNGGKVDRATIFPMAILCALLLVAFGREGHVSNGYAYRMPSVNAAHVIEFPLLTNGWCFYSPDYFVDQAVGNKGLDCWLGNKTFVKKALLFGDSYAGHYDPFWDLVGKKTGLSVNAIATNYCVPTRNEEWTGPADFKAKDQCFYNRRYFVDKVSTYDVVILGGNWMDYSARNKMGDVLDLVDFAASKTRLVVLMAAPKAYDSNPMEFYNKSLLENTVFDITQVPAERDAEEVSANRQLEEVAKKHANVLYIDRDSIFSVDGVPSDVTKDNMPFSLDGGHISTYGSLSAGAEFLQSQKYKNFINMLYSSGSP